MHASFAVTILYSQLLVFSLAGAQIGLDWSDKEVAQGFVWDAEEVAFGLPDHDGDCLVDVDTDRQAPYKLAEDTLWAVAVPYRTRDPVVNIGTVILDPQTVSIAPGSYQLIFEARPGGQAHGYRLHLVFVQDDHPRYAILKRGQELGTDTVLVTQGKRL